MYRLFLHPQCRHLVAITHHPAKLLKCIVHLSEQSEQRKSQLISHDLCALLILMISW